MAPTTTTTTTTRNNNNVHPYDPSCCSWHSYFSRTSTSTTTTILLAAADPNKNVVDDLEELWTTDNNNDDEDNDDPEQDLWMEDPMEEYEFENGPDAFLNDDDLSLLYDIPSLPFLNGTDPTNNNNNRTTTTTTTANTNTNTNTVVLSLQDLQNFSSDVSYFYLRDEIGLSEDAMWKITQKHGSVLGLKASNIREKLQVLRNGMGLNDQDVRTLISAQPSLLCLSARKNLSPTIVHLLRNLNLGRKELRRLVLGCPSLLSYSIHNLNQKIRFFKETMGFSDLECRRLLLEEPRLMSCSVETGLMPRLFFLQKELEIPIPDVCKIVKKNPIILMMSVNANLQPKLIFYFIMTIHLRLPEIKKLLLSYPKVLNYSLEDHIKPIHRYFLSLGFSAHEFGRILLKFPRLVTYSLTKIKHIVGYLRYQLGLEASDVRRILYQAPQVVSLTTDNLQTKVDFLLQASCPYQQQQQRGGGGGEDGGGKTSSSSSSTTSILRKLIVGMPTLLYLSIENNLEPKAKYLREQLGSEELSYALARQPSLLAYSLEKRIKPRLERIQEVGADGGSLTVGIPMKEENFENWLLGRARKARNGVAAAVDNNNEGSSSSGSAKKVEMENTSSIGREESIFDKEKRVSQEDGRIVHWVRRGYGET